MHSHTQPAYRQLIDSVAPSSRCKHVRDGGPVWHFDRYVPSEWEQQWVDNREAWSNAICETMKQYVLRG